jgi:hypothetical protein
VVEETHEDEAPVSEEATTDAPAVSVTPAADEIATEETKAEAVDEPERPKSPWTPSYSVSTQGPGLASEEKAEESASEIATEEPAIVISEATVAAAEQPTEVCLRALSYACADL